MDTVEVTLQEKRQVVFARLFAEEESVDDCYWIYYQLTPRNPLYPKILERILSYTNSFNKCIEFCQRVHTGDGNLRKALLLKGLSYARCTKSCVGICRETSPGTEVWDKASLRALKYIKSYEDAYKTAFLFDTYSKERYAALGLALDYASTTHEYLDLIKLTPAYMKKFIHKILKKALSLAKSTKECIAVYYRLPESSRLRTKALTKADAFAKELDDHIAICRIAPFGSVYEITALNKIQDELHTLSYTEQAEILIEAPTNGNLESMILKNLRENIESLEQYWEAKSIVRNQADSKEYILDGLLKALLDKTNDFKGLMDIYFAANTMPKERVEALERAYLLCI